VNITFLIKYYLWRFGLYPDKCPKCSSNLIGHGFDERGISPAYYTCENIDCPFNKVIE
jgi:hypothetical protein